MPPPLPPQNKQKNPKTTIDGKVNLHYPPSPQASTAARNDASAQSPVSTVSNSPYSLINCNKYFRIASNAKKTEENLKIDDKVTL